MPEFILDTSGSVEPPAAVKFEWPRHMRPPSLRWPDLDAFTQGYIEALFFTETDTLDEQALVAYIATGGEDSFRPEPLGFANLASETLAAILRDCAKFQDSRAWADTMEGHQDADEEHAGRDFWYTRNGHGCGFWDGDWPEPYATQLTDAAKAFGECDVYLGDDGKVYVS